MKKMKFLNLWAIVALLSIGFISCSDDDSNEEENEITKVDLEVKIESTNDLREIADFNVYYTDLSGDSINISEDVAIAAIHQEGDRKLIKDITFPIELNLVMEITLKSDVEDSTYHCGYLVKHSIRLLNEEDDIIRSSNPTTSHNWIPDTPITDNFQTQTYSRKVILKKDNNGEIIIEVGN